MKIRFLVFLASALLTSSAFAQNGSASVDVTLKPAGSFVGKADSVTGTAYRTANGVAAENVIVSVANLTTGIELRDRHTRDYMKTKQYPTVKLVKAVGANGKGDAIIEIMGKQQKVSGTYTIEGNTLKASFKVNLPSVNITGVKYMGIGVADDVTVNVALPLSGARATASSK